MCASFKPVVRDPVLSLRYVTLPLSPVVCVLCTCEQCADFHCGDRAAGPDRHALYHGTTHNSLIM